MSGKTRRRSYRRQKRSRAERIKARSNSDRKRDTRLAHDPVFVVEEELREKTAQEEHDRKLQEARERRKQLIAELAERGLSPTGRLLTPSEKMLYKILPEGASQDKSLEPVVEAVGKILEEGLKEEPPELDIDYETVEKRMAEQILVDE